MRETGPSFVLLTTGLLVGLASCSRWDDCKLYKTCSDSLHERIEALNDNEACTSCIQDPTRAAVIARCSRDFACNYAARCQLTTGPKQYEDCLTRLAKYRLSSGNEDREPWEGATRWPLGEGTEAQESTLFKRFLDAFDGCRAACLDDQRWQCGSDSGGPPGKRTLQLAVRVYPNFQPGACLPIKVCVDERNCTFNQRTDTTGRVDLEVPAGNPARLFFRVYPPEYDADCPEPEDPNQRIDIPRTILYPGYLGNDENAPTALFVFTVTTIEVAQHVLRYPLHLLKERGQVFFLPDSCIHEEISAPNVQISIEDTERLLQSPVAECDFAMIDCPKEPCRPCLWYAWNEAARVPDPQRDPSAQRTDGSGAGVMSLPPGSYDVHVRKAADGKPVAARRFLVEDGWMTIVRTWPGLGI